MDITDYKITCISHRRPENIKSIFETTGTKDVVFFVNDEKDKKDYLHNGAKEVYIGGGLVGNRNKALDYCFSKNLICVQIDDDLKYISLNDFTGKRTGIKNIKVIDVIKDLMPDFISEKYMYAGFPPIANPFFVMKEKDYNKVITAPITFTKPNKLRFDSNISLKEDYDLTLQHIETYGGCIRYGKYLFDFKRYKNSGGVQSYRTEEKEKETVKYLKEKWGACILDNPKRKNEILLSKKSKEILSVKNTQGSLF